MISKTHLKYYLLILALTIGFIPGFAKEVDDDPEVKVYVEVEKEGYVGQPLEYRVMLASTSRNIADVRVASWPNISLGCNVVKGAVNNQKPVEKKEKGKTWYVWTVMRNFIIPEKEGKFEIGEGEYVVFVPFERIVNDFFWGARRMVDYDEIIAKSGKASFKVSNLPEKGRPQDFSGCVGNFTIEGWFPPGEIRVGKEAIVVFRISGFGSLENLKLPNIARSFTDGCSLREIDQNENISQKNGRFFSEVTLTCRFTPETADGEIKPIEIVFFNPDTKKYETVGSEPLKWNNIKTPSTKTPAYDAIEI